MKVNMQKRERLNVFFVVDNNFSIHFTVTLTSLLENNKDLFLSVYVIHDNSGIDGLARIIQFFITKYNVKINTVLIDGNIFSSYPTSDVISKAAYYRLLLAEILPENVDRGLYIDCDTIITGSLIELCYLDFQTGRINEEYSIRAVNDINDKNEIERLKRLGLHCVRYFNSGVIMVNVKKWRDDKVTQELFRTADKYKENLKWHDQDILNIFFRKACGDLDQKYNQFSVAKFQKLPLIIHFSGLPKPWHFISNDPNKKLYWKYLKLTPFKNKKFEKITFQKVARKYVRLVKSIAKIESKVR